VELEGQTLLDRIRIYNRHVDSLLRQGGFHEQLRHALLPLHRSIKLSFEKAVADYFASSGAEPRSFEKASGSSLAPVLWWPRRSGGLGARHHLVLLHDACSCLSSRLPKELSVDPSALQTHFQRMSDVPASRNESYETMLRNLFGPLISELFGTHTVLDERYTSLLS
jgi:hypothetical protein